MAKKRIRKPAAKRPGRLQVELRSILEERKRKLQESLQAARESVRAESHRPTIDAEHVVDVQEDISLRLIETQAALIRRIDQALRQVDAGTYGLCMECRDPIAANRLRALPFAVRCTACEEALEQGEERTRRQADRVSLFSDLPVGQ